MPLQCTSGSSSIEQPLDGRIAEDDDVVHAAQRADQLRAIGRGQDRPPGALQRGHRPIVVDRHDQPVGLGRRALQISDVADVQQVEAAVGERDRRARAGRDRRCDRLDRAPIPLRTVPDCSVRTCQRCTPRASSLQTCRLPSA